MLDQFGVTEENWRDAVEQVPHFSISESPTYVARGLAALAADPGNVRYAGQRLSSGQLARIYGITDADGSRPDCWSYVTEIEDAGLPPAKPATGKLWTAMSRAFRTLRGLTAATPTARVPRRVRLVP